MLPNSLFIDTSGWASYLHAGDPFHDEAVRLYQTAYKSHATLVTTDHVLAELVALLSSSHYRMPRARVITIMTTILGDPGVMVEVTTWPQFLESWNLLARRPDKLWSLADAISFQVMERRSILDALTTDEHLEQANKVRLLK